MDTKRISCRSIGVLLTGLASTTGHTDNFAGARYDAAADELVVTMNYQGTNSDHGFTVHWGDCETADDEHGMSQVTAVVEDDQWNDAAETAYTKTVHFSLDELACRPAQVTLRTAPRFFYTLTIPAAPAAVAK